MCAAQRTKLFVFSLETNLGGFCSLKMGGNNTPMALMAGNTLSLTHNSKPTFPYFKASQIYQNLFPMKMQKKLRVPPPGRVATISSGQLPSQRPFCPIWVSCWEHPGLTHNFKANEAEVNCSMQSAHSGFQS